MTTIRKPASPGKGKTGSQKTTNLTQHIYHKKALYQRLKSFFLRWTKAVIGILFCRNLISFDMACKLSDFWRVSHE
jgi:hypothetical protein